MPGVTFRRRASEVHGGFGSWGLRALAALGRQGEPSLLGSRFSDSFRGRFASRFRLGSEGTTTQSFRTSLRRWRERLSRGDSPRALRLRSGSAGVHWLRPVEAVSCSKHVLRSARERGDGTSGNRRRAKAAVMRYGCWRGEFVEGYEPRCGEASRQDQGDRDLSRARVRGRRKRNEPHGRYQVAINLGLARRANRHGGETPRRRNVMPGWHQAYEAEPFGAKWEKPARRVCRRRGRRMTKRGGSASTSASVGVGGGPAL